MHGGTQTIRFWGLQHVHWCEGSCCWFLRLQSRLVWDVPKALQGRQGMCGSLAGWFQVAIQAVDWFVPEHHLYWFKVSFLRGSPSAFDAWWHANNPLLGATTCPLVWRLMLLVLAAAKQVGLRCSQGFARSTGDVRQPGRLVSGGYPGRRLVCSRASSIYIGLRCRFCEVHRRHLMHGGTQTIRFWGLQHVHWCEGSCCWFLRLQSRLVWDVPKALQGRQGMCGSLAGWFPVAIQAVDWFVPEHHLYWFKVSFLRGSPSAFDAWWHANNPLLGATTCPLVWRLMLLVLAAAKQVGLRCSQGFARSTGDVRQPGRLVSGGYPGRRLVCSRASSIYIGLRCRFCEVHHRHLMHGGTQTIRFWGLQHVHWCEGSCCWFLRLQSRLVWDVPKALQGRQGMCGSLAGWFQVAIQAVDWFVPEHHLYWFKVSFLRGSPSAFDAWWHANNPLLGATTCPLVWRLMLLVLAAAKQVGLRCSQGFARSTGDVRQPGRLVSGGYPGRRLVCSRASSILV